MAEEKSATLGKPNPMPRRVFKSFIGSIMDNVLLGGFMVTGLIILMQKYVAPTDTDIVAIIFITIPLAAWAYRYYLAEERKDI